MSLINIPQHRDDPFYRYCRNQIKIGRIKTGIAIDNLEIIGKQIYLMPATILKYLQKTIGCKSQITKDGIYILYNQNISAQELDEHLEKFICDVVLCPYCGNPEVRFNRRGKKLIKGCNACPESKEIKNDDLKKILVGEGN